jgi:hypothetical protein
VHRAADLVQDVLQLGRLGECARPPMLASGIPRRLVGSHVTNDRIAVQ